eukprot:gene3180-9990_t
MDFAVRLNDGAGSLNSADTNLASTCAAMMVTDPGGKKYPGGLQPTRAGSFALTFTPAAGKTLDDAVITVAFAAGPSLPGVGAPGSSGVFVTTYPPSAMPKPPPAPAPKPAGTPVMRLLADQTCRGSRPVSKVDEQGQFALAITVAGDAGFAYNCSAVYDPAVGVADGDCTDWLPQSVLDAREGLAVTLEATDSAGKLAVCMNWELTFNATGSGAAAWSGDGTSPATVAATKEMLRRPAYGRLLNERLARGAEPRGAAANNTESTRVAAFGQYLDSMTHVSHRCVPKGQPAYG